MKEITEDYVSFETAKLLKEKGFIGSEEIGCTCGFYSETVYQSGYGIITKSGKEVGLVFDTLDNKAVEYNEYLRPTINIAMKWLLKEHHYYIQVMLDTFIGCHCGYYVVIKKTDSDFELTLYDEEEQVFYETPKEAYEAAIKYCLENLV